MMKDKVLRRLTLFAAVVLGLAVWAAVGAEEGETEEPERDVTWTAELPGGVVPEGQLLPEPFAAREDSYGYSSDVSVGELAPDSFVHAGETITVRSLGYQQVDSARELAMVISRELPDYSLLHIGTDTLQISDASTPASLSSGDQWGDVGLAGQGMVGRQNTFEYAESDL